MSDDARARVASPAKAFVATAYSGWPGRQAVQPEQGRQVAAGRPPSSSARSGSRSERMRSKGSGQGDEDPAAHDRVMKAGTLRQSLGARARARSPIAAGRGRTRRGGRCFQRKLDVIGKAFAVQR